MRITKAIIPLAGRATRLFPATKSIPKAMLPIVGADGVLMPIIHHIVQQAFDGGIREICLIVDPASESIFRHYFDDGKCRNFAEAGEIKMSFALQAEPKGLGDAILQAEDFTGNSPVLIMLGDYLYLDSADGISPVSELLDAFEQNNCDSLVGLQQIGPDELSSCGVVSGSFLSDERTGLFELTKIIEKPNLKTAEKELRIETLPEKSWLAFFGLYAFTAVIFQQLRNSSPAGSELTLTDAQQNWLRSGGKHLGKVSSGRAVDLGTHEKILNWFKQC